MLGRALLMLLSGRRRKFVGVGRLRDRRLSWPSMRAREVVEVGGVNLRKLQLLPIPTSPQPRATTDPATVITRSDHD